MPVLSVLTLLKQAQLVAIRSLEGWLMDMSGVVCWTFDPGLRREADPSSSPGTQGPSHEDLLEQ